MRSANSPTTLTMSPMTKREAGVLVKRMLGSYPSLNLHDPQTYIASVCALLNCYPVWAGENAVRAAITGEESKFVPPTLGILRPLLEAEVRVHRYAAEWEKGAKEQLQLLAGPPQSRPTLAELREKYGPNWGIGAPKHVPTQTEARESLIAQIGQEAFDAIPDAGIRSDDWQKMRAEKIGDAA